VGQSLGLTQVVRSLDRVRTLRIAPLDRVLSSVREVGRSFEWKDKKDKETQHTSLHKKTRGLLGGIGVRNTPQSRYAVQRTSMPRRGGGGRWRGGVMEMTT